MTRAKMEPEVMMREPGRPMKLPRTSFESKLRDIMFDAGIQTYASLAMKSHLAENTIQQICSGVRKPSIQTLKKLSMVLGTTIDELV